MSLPNIEPIVDQPKKVKKPRTEKQKAALKKAQEARRRKAAERKQSVDVPTPTAELVQVTPEPVPDSHDRHRELIERLDSMNTFATTQQDVLDRLQNISGRLNLIESNTRRRRTTYHYQPSAPRTRNEPSQPPSSKPAALKPTQPEMSLKEKLASSTVSF